jgi:hypothetical protein
MKFEYYISDLFKNTLSYMYVSHLNTLCSVKIAIQKFKDQYIYITTILPVVLYVWVWSLVADIEGGT